MYIKLLNADASAKNLGQISTVELDQTVMDIMLNMTRFSMSSPVAYYLNEFIKTIKDNELWDSIQILYLPWLAGQVDELLYNPQNISLTFCGNSDHLYADDGVIYIKPGVTANVGDLQVIMPNYDCQGKTLCLGSNSVSGKVVVVSDSYSTVSVARPIINIGTLNRCGIGGSYNWNIMYGLSMGDVCLGSSISIPSSDFPTGLRITGSDFMAKDYTLFDYPTVPYTFIMSTLNIGCYVSDNEIINTPVNVTGNCHATYMLFNRTITETEMSIMARAMHVFMTNVNTLGV